MRTIVLSVLLSSTARAASLLGFIHPLPAAPGAVPPSGLIPEACRDKVYIFVINGMDPTNIGNLKGMCDYIRGLGYRHTEFGQMFTAPVFAHRIRLIYQEDPAARFVIIGYSRGVSPARCMVQSESKGGIPIDLAVYLDACSLNSVPAHHPGDARRIVNIMTDGFLLVMRTKPLYGVENYHLWGVRHLGLPTHPWVLQTLAEELNRVAACVAPLGPASPEAAAGP